MPHNKTVILDHQKIEQKINRIAYQIYEDNYDQKKIIMAGIAENGYKLAGLLKKKVEEISKLEVSLLDLHIDKKNPIDNPLEIKLDKKALKNHSIILVDDVLNSGKTMIYGLQHFLSVPIKKLSTAVLVNRSHKRFPVSADYVGLSLATTLQEHIEVDLSDNTAYKAYLS